VGAIEIGLKTKNLSTSQEVLRLNGKWRADVNECKNWEMVINIEELIFGRD